jgi:uncharacterized protein with PIN domain
MKFLVDAPLGGLAKWLRFCGFDAALRPLARRAGSLPPPQPDILLLTLQKPLAKLHREDILVLAAATPEAQLEEVLQRLKVDRRKLHPMSRCVRCNEPLAPVTREAAAGRAPEYVVHTQKEFWECPVCRRLYWPGSHLTGITAKVFEALRRPGGKPEFNSSGHL